MTNDEVATGLVVVTGASGFIGLHCVKELLGRGYQVRGTVRSLKSKTAVEEALRPHVASLDRLSLVEAELMQDAGWDEAMRGAKFVLHVASPLPKAEPKDENELIVPAREGTLRVLKAAARAGVSRVVLTSSMAAVFSGRDRHTEHVYDENDWLDLNGKLGAYEKSKGIAERAAWDYVASLPADQKLELVAVNPVFVIGPPLGTGENASSEIVGKLLKREVPGSARLHLGLVDVRDVATAEVLAMTHPEAAGERFILMSDLAWFGEIAQVLAEAGYDVPTRLLPNWLVQVVSWFDPTLRLVVGSLGLPFRASSEKATRVLGWQGRSMKEMVLATAERLAPRASV